MTTPPSRRPSILVVDDESMIRLILERALSRKYEVTSVEGPQEALEALDRQRFDLVMTDINMPGGSGLALADTIRRQTPPTTLAFLAAVVDEETHARIEDIGAPLFLKPFDLPELLTMVDALIASST